MLRKALNCTASGVQLFTTIATPGSSQARYRGVNVQSRLRRAQPGGLKGHKPRVERFVRYPGSESGPENAPRMGCVDYLRQVHYAKNSDWDCRFSLADCRADDRPTGHRPTGKVGR